MRTIIGGTIMYTLYWAKNSGALAPQILLQEVEADYQRVILDLGADDQHRADFLAVNPKGQVPALLLDDGSILTESAAIMLHIADSHPDKNLLPPLGSNQRAQVYRWLFYAVANIYEADLRLFYSEIYADDPGCADSIKTRARTDMDAAWEMLEQALGDGPYLLGNSYSVIDPYLTMLVQWHEQPQQLLARCPRLKRLCDAVIARPACQAIWQQHYPD